MTQATRLSTAFAVSFIVLSGAMTGPGRAATQEQIGSWVLDCPGGTPHAGPCIMRASKRFFGRAGITGDLEIEAQGKSLVPVIALRGLTPEMLATATTMGGKAEASIQLGGFPRQELSCAAAGAGYFCSPTEATAQKLATALPEARSATLRVLVSMPGMNALPAQERSLDLSGTKQAMARLRAAGPTQVPRPSRASATQSPAGIMQMADKALKAAGYQNGVADLQAMLGKQRTGEKKE